MSRVAITYCRQYLLQPAVLAIAVIALAVSYWDNPSWLELGLVGLFATGIWHTRKKKWAMVPGAAIAVLLLWSHMPTGASPEGALFLTIVAANLGGALNAIVRQYYIYGITVIVLHACLFLFLATAS